MFLLCAINHLPAAGAGCKVLAQLIQGSGVTLVSAHLLEIMQAQVQDARA